MKPLVSVVIPLYNKELYIKETILSVLNQTFSDFEIIVVNDGSTDNGLNVVEHISDPRLRVVSKHNGGVSSARNVGIKEARGDWLFFLDGDDAIKKDCLEILVDLHETFPQADVCCANFEVVYPGCKTIVYCKSLEQYLVDNNYRDFWKQKIFLRTGNMLVKRNVFDVVGFFDETVSVYEDLELFVEILLHCRIAYSPKVIFVYKKGGSEASKNFSSKKRMFDICLSGMGGYRKKVCCQILIDELITGRRNWQFVKKQLLKNKGEWIYIAVHFIPCFYQSMTNAMVLQRLKNKLTNFKRKEQQN